MEMYKFSDCALKKYRNEAKNFNKLPIEILNLKFSAIINNAGLKNNDLSIYTYQFAGLIIKVNNSTNIIEEIQWLNAQHTWKKDGKYLKLYPSIIKKLKLDYSKLGLSPSGNSFINKNKLPKKIESIIIHPTSIKKSVHKTSIFNKIKTILKSPFNFKQI